MIVSISPLMSSAVTLPASGAGGDTLMLNTSWLLHWAAAVSFLVSSASAGAAVASRAAAEVAVTAATACRYMVLPEGDDPVIAAISTLSGGSITS
ncbi:hypothetical protein BKM31_50605 [[Actinomadura] parvosata subsp. kistnae]|uniref:Uncharacterized protein n=1 Tax=[Actinomadura] parvosata subsp. kistnae TaxID=1909395 RepID=A0A1V0AEW2_9ACTN|nr:hypothetical protein BKM31_50605 [Nonomuraea sp. ATCC 55076]